MFNRTVSALAAAALAAGTVAIATPVHASSIDEVVTVSYGDLDLSNPADAARFEGRVRAAARTVCGSYERQPLGLAQRALACEKDVIANTKADLQTATAKPNGSFRLALRTR